MAQSLYSNLFEIIKPSLKVLFLTLTKEKNKKTIDATDAILIDTSEGKSYVCKMNRESPHEFFNGDEITTKWLKNQDEKYVTVLVAVSSKTPEKKGVDEETKFFTCKYTYESKHILIYYMNLGVLFKVEKEKVGADFSKSIYIKRFRRCQYGKCAKDPVKSAKKCSGCKLVRYCSPECQIADWPTHKQSCRQEELD